MHSIILMELWTYKHSSLPTLEGVIKSSNNYQYKIKPVKYIKDIQQDNIFSVFGYVTNTTFKDADFVLYLYKFADSTTKEEYGDRSFIEIVAPSLQNQDLEKFYAFYSNQIKLIYENNILYVGDNGKDYRYVFKNKDDYVKIENDKDWNRIRIYYSVESLIDWNNLEEFLVASTD
jgi:hypothetical protein